MKLNPIERWVVNSPVRRIGQHLVMQWFKSTVAVKAGTAILEVGCGRGVGAKLIYETYQQPGFASGISKRQPDLNAYL